MPIHPTAIVSPEAKLAPDVDVGPHVVIDGPVTIGAGTKIWPNAYLAGDTVIGAQCEIHLGAVVGHTPQIQSPKDQPGRLVLGDRNVIREYVTIHRGSKPDSVTRLGHENYLMALSHVAHDCVLGNRVVICNGTLLAGHISIGDQAFISGNCVIHQFVRIGRLALIAGGTRIGKDVPPYFWAEPDNLIVGLNLVGLRRAGLPAAERQQLKRAYELLYRSGMTTSHALETLERDSPSDPVRHLIEFVRASTRGICPSQPIRGRREPEAVRELSELAE